MNLIYNELNYNFLKQKSNEIQKKKLQKFLTFFGIGAAYKIVDTHS